MVATHLNITLEFKEEGATFDLRVPLHLTFSHFVELVRESLELPPIINSVQGKIERNQQLLSAKDYLFDSPLQNGDRLVVF